MSNRFFLYYGAGQSKPGRQDRRSRPLDPTGPGSRELLADSKR